MSIDCNQITLREMTKDNFYNVCELSVKEEQKGLVDSNAVSIAEAYFSDHAWLRAIYLDDTPVGFVMLDARPDVPKYYLWRFMVDANYQGYGIGRKAMTLLAKEIKSWPGGTELFTSIVPSEHGPQKFYESLGFELTGQMVEGRELEMRLLL